MGHAYAEGTPVPPELQIPSPVPLCPRPDKVRYRDEADVSRQLARYSTLPGRAHIHAYHCDCGWWHLSSMSRAEHAAVQERKGHR